MASPSLVPPPPPDLAALGDPAAMRALAALVRGAAAAALAAAVLPGRVVADAVFAGPLAERVRAGVRSDVARADAAVIELGALAGRLEREADAVAAARAALVHAHEEALAAWTRAVRAEARTA